MLRSGERAYVYAKACGIIGKSFVGKRIAGLGAVNRLSELDRLVFPDTFRDLPERELLMDLERRVIGRAADQIITIVNSFAKPPDLLIRLLRAYEYGDLKGAIIALAAGETAAPAVTELGRFRTVHFEAYPELRAMIRGTEFEFLLKEPAGQGRGRFEDPAHAAEKTQQPDIDSILMQTRLDRHYYTTLWESLFELPKKDRSRIQRILEEEIALRNAAWVLRLRTYYQMRPNAIREHLVFLSGGKGRGESLSADAAAALELPLDTYAPWTSWKRVSFLNPEKPGEHWTADPRYFQNAASQYLYRMARLAFRRNPFSLDTAACFIKLKQFEEDLLTSIAEGLALGIASRDVMTMLEVKP